MAPPRRSITLTSPFHQRTDHRYAFCCSSGVFSLLVQALVRFCRCVCYVITCRSRTVFVRMGVCVCVSWHLHARARALAELCAYCVLYVGFYAQLFQSTAHALPLITIMATSNFTQDNPMVAFLQKDEKRRGKREGNLGKSPL